MMCTRGVPRQTPGHEMRRHDMRCIVRSPSVHDLRFGDAEVVSHVSPGQHMFEAGGVALIKRGEAHR